MRLERPPVVASNPLRLTLHNRGTLLISDRDGGINGGLTGLYAHDTRYLSLYRLTLNRAEAELLSTARLSYFSLTHTYTNPPFGPMKTIIPRGSLFLRVDRAVGDGLHEDITLTNYSGRPVDLHLRISLDTDFADIMQVRDTSTYLRRLTAVDWARRIPRVIDVDWDNRLNVLTFSYRREDFERVTTYRLIAPGASPRHLTRTIEIGLTIAPGTTWRASTVTTLDAPELGTAIDVTVPFHHRAETTMVREAQQWVSSVARIVVPDAQLQATFDRAVLDFASLRLEKVGDGWFPAAGVPWFAAIFGRDSIWASLQSLLVSTSIARGTLRQLAALQGHADDPRRDEEPGKLPHEVREGELTWFGRLPYSPYFGTADAPLLYVILLAEEYFYSGDRAIAQACLEVANRCLDWAAEWGDLDGDGFVEYRPRSPQGYHNQGWKDAFDAIVYPDGRQVGDPIALCEIQGYYYAAMRAIARLLRAIDRPDEAGTWEGRARNLYQRFNDVFWMPEEHFYALGLDPNKEQIRTIASNAGQLLWTQIVPTERAGLMCRRLFSAGMNSGWGIRTLSQENPAYNPISYQRGSVWPHDNGIIAMGLKRYGLWREANQIARAIYDAAAHFEGASLPELFAGLERRIGEPPVPYVEANVPQAWAAGSILQLFHQMLGIEVDAPNDVVVARPTLPDWLPWLELCGLRAGATELDLRFSGAGPATRVDVLRRDGPARLLVLPAPE